ncbi:ATP-binding protein [Pseudoroseomonas cervicalis]|uniref:sensor histidine kinase n=1 Tax=Teichococcus cervicalis TaxID=204525 RepID=UPI002788697C|nr:ATP-binding protein [Pseudoroseomonas cervicalis]MDQ1078074.1 PAS domain S-box-containing protein [Pseudoroseomonas cervicalis]
MSPASAPPSPGAMGRLLRRLGLARQIMLLTVLLGLALVGVTGGISLAFIHHHLLEDVREKEESLAALQAQRVALQINAIAANLVILSSSSLAQTAVVDSVGRETYFLPLLQSYGLTEGVAIGLYDYEGQRLLHGRDPMPESFRGARWIERVMHGLGQAGLHTAPDGPRLLVALPVVSPFTRLTEGMLVALIDGERLLRSQLTASPERRFSLVAEGEPIAAIGASPPLEESLRVEQPLPLETPLNRLWLGLRMEHDRRAALAPMVELFRLLAGIGGAVLLAIFGIALLLGRRLARPLVRLAEVARAVTETGGLRHAVPQGQAGEIGVLSEAFRAMLAHLEALHDTLEQRVADRTAELHAAQREVAAQAARLHAMFEQAIYPILILGPGEIIESANPALQRLLGFSPQEIIGRPFSALVAGDLHALRAVETGDGQPAARATWEFDGRHRKGGVVPLEMARSEMVIEGRRLEMAVLCDISERRRVDRLKDEFVSTVSHELRTPLTSIRGSLGLVASGRLGPMPDAARRLLDIALGNSERLVLLVNDILDIQKIESGSMTFDMAELDLAALLRQAVEANEAYARQHGVRFGIAASPEEGWVRADSGRIMQVLTNLMSNAAKFSPREGEVALTLKREAGWLRLEVADHGPGVPEEFRPKLFSRFAQADGSDRRAKGGTGLGLAISQALIEQQGGRIGYAPRPEGGSLFYFALPELAEMPQARAAARAGG